MKNFVTGKWLVGNINNEDLIILDARAALSDPLEGRKQYNKGHIKGAQFVSLKDTMTGDIKTHGGRHPLPELDKFLKEMENKGVSDRSKVVIYDDGSIAMAGRLWWLLKYIGKEEVYILKGGIEAYTRESGELTDEIPENIETGQLELDINKDMNVGMDYVRDIIGKEDRAIVDVRAHERYIGKVEPLDAVAGHIESALNYPWEDSFKDGELMSLEKLEERFQDLKKYKEVVVHCGSGITGTVMVLLLDELGVDSKLYAGGYSDWISYKENKVVKGE